MIAISLILIALAVGCYFLYTRVRNLDRMPDWSSTSADPFLDEPAERAKYDTPAARWTYQDGTPLSAADLESLIEAKRVLARTQAEARASRSAVQ